MNQFNLVDFANELGDAIDSEWVLSNKIMHMYSDLKEHLIESKQAVWNEESKGLDQIE